ncbi:hypothetical protein KY284_020802 [Solanum tuberosum]|nr:hypothetical protein KY284_020802 [Solanum tuberosum]
MDHPPLSQPVDPPPETAGDAMASEILPESSNSGVMKKKKTKKKKKNKACVTDPFDPHSSAASYSSSSCSATSFPPSNQRGIRVSTGRRNPRVIISSGRQKSDNVEALALPLGMSIAAVLAQVLERKDAAGEKISVDHLSEICTLAVRESLANVFGDQFEPFVRNFEKSFHSTLMTLRLISESSMNSGVQQHNCAARISVSERSVPFFPNRAENVTCDPNFGEFQLESFQQNSSDNELSNQEERSDGTCRESIGRQLTFYDRQVRQQLASASSSMISSNSEISQSVHRTLERSLTEQARSNDLKTFEIGLTMRKLQLKERQLALSSDANLLERVKLSFGFSKTSFKTEKFKNQVEDSKHAELLKTCIDCLVAGLFIMLACLGYGTYVFSHKRITEATASCTPSMQIHLLSDATKEKELYQKTCRPKKSMLVVVDAAFRCTAFISHGNETDIFYVPGTQVLVDAPINVIHQFRTATLTVSGSSSQSHAIWCFADIGYSLFTSPALCNFKSDYASYFHSVAVGSWLRFCREVLY